MSDPKEPFEAAVRAARTAAHWISSSDNFRRITQAALAAALPPDPAPSIADHKTKINKRVQARYDELREAGKHGHYETMFQVVHEELDAAYRAIRASLLPGEE